MHKLRVNLFQLLSTFIIMFGLQESQAGLGVNCFKADLIFEVDKISNVNNHTSRNRLPLSDNDVQATGITSGVINESYLEAFLKQVVALKNTRDERFFLQDDGKSASCEYIGTLWFLSRRKHGGVQFRETLRMLDDNLTSDGVSKAIECCSQYRNSKGKWIDCARTKAVYKEISGNKLEVEVSSKLDMKIWVPSTLARSVTKKISDTYKEATLAFYSHPHEQT